MITKMNKIVREHIGFDSDEDMRDSLDAKGIHYKDFEDLKVGDKLYTYWNEYYGRVVIKNEGNNNDWWEKQLDLYWGEVEVDDTREFEDLKLVKLQDDDPSYPAEIWEYDIDKGIHARW